MSMSLPMLRKLAENPHYKMTEAEVAQLQQLSQEEFNKNHTNTVKHNPTFDKHNPNLEEEGHEQDSRNANDRG